MPTHDSRTSRNEKWPSRWWAVWCWAVLMAAWFTDLAQPAPLAAQAVALETTGDAATSGSLADLERLLSTLVAREAGLEWNDEKNWGQQTEVQDGLRFRRDDGRLETERTWKKVNHGRWEKYAAAVRPGSENFRITLPRLETGTDGSSLVTVRVRALLDLSARISQWNRGLQLYSLSADGWADVQLELDARVSTRADWTEIPPAMVVQPEVLAVRVTIHELQLDRISKLGGEFSQQVGQLARSVIEDKLRERESGLVERLNRKIGEQADRLRFSLHDIEWPQWLEPGQQDPPASPDPGDAKPASGG
jgi:hypothetical protein